MTEVKAINTVQGYIEHVEALPPLKPLTSEQLLKVSGASDPLWIKREETKETPMTDANNDLKHKDIWLVKWSEEMMAKYPKMNNMFLVQIEIYPDTTVAYRFGDEVDFRIKDFEFVHKIDVPELNT